MGVANAIGNAVTGRSDDDKAVVIGLVDGRLQVEKQAASAPKLMLITLCGACRGATGTTLLQCRGSRRPRGCR
jgi:hypothetical protein